MTMSMGTRSPAGERHAAQRGPFLTLLPVMAAVSAAFLTIGVASPVLPLHVHDGLGLGALVAGVLVGSNWPLLRGVILSS